VIRHLRLLTVGDSTTSRKLITGAKILSSHKDRNPIQNTVGCHWLGFLRESGA